MLKNYGYSFLIVISSLLIINLFLTIFSYFNLFSTKVIDIMGFVLMLVFLFISSYILGTKSKKNGYLEGLKFGGIIVLIFILLVILLDKFLLKSLIYYVILILTRFTGDNGMKNLYTDYKCIKCLFDKYSKIDNTELSDNDKTLYVKDLLKIILNAPTTMSAPEIVEKITELQKKYRLKIFDYKDIKNQYNKHKKK